jgi:hypothetical protein
MNCEQEALVEWCILWVIIHLGLSNGLTVIPDLVKIRPDYRLEELDINTSCPFLSWRSVQGMHKTDAQEYNFSKYPKYNSWMDALTGVSRCRSDSL